MSLRHKFSRLWVQETERPVTSHGKSSSEATVMLAAAPTAEDSQPTHSRRLHKAASTTFQALSESLRSKAQTFYTAPPSSPQPRTPRTIWSSVRGRGSRSSRSAKDMPTSFDAPETPTKEERSSLDSEQDQSLIEFTPIDDAPPRISTEIPQSSLVDSLDDGNGDVTSPTVTPIKSGLSVKQPQPSTISPTLRCEPKYLRPSPHMHLRGLTLAEQAPAKAEQAELALQGLLHPSASKGQSAAIHFAFEEQPFWNKIVEFDQIPAPEASAVSQSTAKGPYHFECDRNSSEDYKGTFWPAGKVLKSCKRFLLEDGDGMGAEAGMGPREPWETAQANRRKRHAELQSVYTIGGCDPQPDLEGSRNPSMLNKSNTLKDPSREQGQSPQFYPSSSPLSQDPDRRQNLKAYLEGPSDPSTTPMTKKVRSVSSLHVNYNDSERPNLSNPAEDALYEASEGAKQTAYDRFEVEQLLQGHHEQHGQESWLLPGSDLFPELNERYHYHDRTEVAPHSLNERLRHLVEASHRRTSSEASSESSDSEDSAKGHDADKSSPEVSSSDNICPTESEPKRAKVKPWTSSYGRHARYTSTPTPSSPSSSPPREIGKTYVKTYHSTGRSGSPSDPVWLEAHQKRVEAYIVAQSKKYMFPGEADFSSIDRSAEIRRSVPYYALCQFIYQCERESQEEEDADSEA
ncbi:MAG: hypothetical protein Q9169_005851 [Polycauliona sp. 2 TL-2023]